MFAEAETRTPSDLETEVLLLTPEAVGQLGLGLRNRVGAGDARAILKTYPGRSVWTPETHEYALVAPWRHRCDIAAVQELAAVRHAETLLAAVVERCRAAGDALVLVVELDETRRPAAYARAGFLPIEEVVTYELERPDATSPTGPLAFTPVSSTEGEDLIDLLRIDHSAFPWLWWNSEVEFASYIGTPGVQVFLGRWYGEPVAYVGVTSYGAWGHLDRIAVDPRAQGTGLGRQALGFACATLATRGARRVGLSTQRDNVRSQRLYERFGFRRSRAYDYRLYGAALRDPASHQGF